MSVCLRFGPLLGSFVAVPSCGATPKLSSDSYAHDCEVLSTLKNLPFPILDQPLLQAQRIPCPSSRRFCFVSIRRRPVLFVAVNNHLCAFSVNIFRLPTWRASSPLRDFVIPRLPISSICQIYERSDFRRNLAVVRRVTSALIRIQTRRALRLWNLLLRCFGLVSLGIPFGPIRRLLGPIVHLQGFA